MPGLLLGVSCFCGIIVTRTFSQVAGLMSRRDFSRYDEQKEMIESVGLVKAKRGKLVQVRRDIELTHRRLYR